MNATISACSDELLSGTTRFTPTATRRLLPISKMAAPNGPPVPRSTFSRASSIATRVRRSVVSYVAAQSTTSSTQLGQAIRISGILPGGMRCKLDVGARRRQLATGAASRSVWWARSEQHLHRGPRRGNRENDGEQTNIFYQTKSNKIQLNTSGLVTVG